MKRIAPYLAAFYLIATAGIQCAVPLSAAEFNIVDYGATPGDDSDDTLAVIAALNAAREAGGGLVKVPVGEFRISRQGAESPIVAIPSNTILQGEGAASTLKFDPAVNKSNFWRMLGAPAGGCQNIVIRDLHLDGSSTHPRYEKGVPEQSHGIFLYAVEGDRIENVLCENLLIENFAGDCIAVGRGCRNIRIRDITLRNFLRQGVQLGGSEDARDYLVTGVQDLEGEVQAGGSTIHVEHARGLQGVILTGNHCRRSILAGGVDGLIIRDNVVTGRIVGNGNLNCIVQGNIVRSDGGAAAMQFGYAQGLLIESNVVIAAGPEQSAIYVWGQSRYNAEPSRDIIVRGNLITTPAIAVSLNGVEGAIVGANRLKLGPAAQALKTSRCQDVETDQAAPEPTPND